MQRHLTSHTLPQLLSRKTTLYFTSHSPAPVIRGKQLVAREEIPLSQIRRVCLIGKAALNSDTLYALMKHNIPIDWLDIFGKPIGQLMLWQAGNEYLHLRQLQYETSPAALELAKAFLLAKIDNCHELLRHKVSFPQDWQPMRVKLANATQPDSLRGAEGHLARLYYSLWPPLIGDFNWQGRKPHPAPDPLNLLLSWGYSIMHNRLAAALRANGLDARIGVLHATRGTHCALASDLMEPFRVFIDTCVLHMIHQGTVKPEFFKTSGTHCVCAEPKSFSRILGHFEELFLAEHTFYPSPNSPADHYKRTVNDALDDVALGFAAYIKKEGGPFVPRLTRCPHTLYPMI